MARSTEPWIGKTDDTQAPPRVRLRIFDRDKGICHLCGKRIESGEKWQADHRVAVINAGANSEENLSPAHIKCHAIKSGTDVKEKSKVAAVRKKHLGITSPKAKISSQGFPTTERAAKRSDKIPVPPPRQLYRQEQT